MTAAEILGWIGGVAVVLGGIFMVIGALGVVRMPDVFTRIHAASVADTLGVSLILLGLVCLAGLTLVSVKLVFLALFIAFTSPAATHAVARAALHANVRPLDRSGEPMSAENPDGEGEPSKP
ncbi:MAG: monovalent cation/H(+) antiporter subunit G [Bauldia sp.]|uniref:monovalent cation/H(+) antiporter subunit G n=1 Tax=Bauldia sp. TaxID=2575872 RepID=UPI001E1452B1|nr:monovalent cation/H(+) antiporter subunit G [Bauldia sp.]MCB1495192.1 monovalent cation/H(+) antiporter subunit G [Bauldia sp.]